MRDVGREGSDSILYTAMDGRNSQRRAHPGVSVWRMKNKTKVGQPYTIHLNSTAFLLLLVYKFESVFFYNYNPQKHHTVYIIYIYFLVKSPRE